MATELDRMRIRELYTSANYDERPAIADLQEVVIRIEDFVAERGGILRVKGRDLLRVLLHYVSFRMRTPYTMIHCTRPVRRPKNWLRVHEDAWLAWMEDTFPMDEWIGEVMDPVFGSDVRTWETNITSWRHEIASFLPFWLDRSFEPITEPLDEELEY